MCESEGCVAGGAPVLSFLITGLISVMTRRTTRPSWEAPLCKHFTAFFQSVAVLHGAYRGQFPGPDVHGSCCRPCADTIIKQPMIRADADTGTKVAQHSTQKNPNDTRKHCRTSHANISHNYKIKSPMMRQGVIIMS